jgi:hypothetical protein
MQLLICSGPKDPDNEFDKVSVIPLEYISTRASTIDNLESKYK